jgi:hypothetical protein
MTNHVGRFRPTIAASELSKTVRRRSTLRCMAGRRPKNWPTCDAAAPSRRPPPKVDIKPGLAQETLRELAALLAEEGIDAGTSSTWPPCASRSTGRSNGTT